MRTAHAAVIGSGWGLITIGAALARFKSKPWWYRCHRGFQTAGFMLCLCGFAQAVVLVEERGTQHFDGIQSLVIMILLVLQVILAALRPHAPGVERGEEKTKVRRVWEESHKWLGRILIV
ncbi:unnamed protein product, partial [Chrysoparadoxa australica]